MPLTVPVLRILEVCGRERTEGPLVLRSMLGKPSTGATCSDGAADREGRQDPKAHQPHSLRHAAITNALNAGVPLRDTQILARHGDPRTNEHYNRARGNLDRHGVHFVTVSVGVQPNGLATPRPHRVLTAHFDAARVPRIDERSHWGPVSAGSKPRDFTRQVSEPYADRAGITATVARVCTATREPPAVCTCPQGPRQLREASRSRDGTRRRARARSRAGASVRLDDQGPSVHR
jgi:hypothetical protein